MPRASAGMATSQDRHEEREEASCLCVDVVWTKLERGMVTLGSLFGRLVMGATSWRETR